MNIGLRQHPLDPCVFLSYNGHRKVDGFVLLYVDDLLGAGDTSGGGNSCWPKRLPKIKAAFKYRTWLSDDHMTYCGGGVVQKGPPGTVELKFEAYAKKLKPVTLDKPRGGGERPLDAKELRMFRGLLGALQWPASQAYPGLSYSVSL